MQNFRNHDLKYYLKAVAVYLRSFVLWVLLGCVLGLVGGLVGAAFSHSVRIVTGFRTANPLILWFLPLGGLLIAGIYSIPRLKAADTNRVLLAIHTKNSIPAATAPVIFISAVLSHLFGASVGREGAALQMGGVLGGQLARILHMKEKDTHLVVMCGMSAVFSALFGCPLAAAVFSMEVASVGILHFSAIVPCLTSALAASYLAGGLGAMPESFPLAAVPALSLRTAGLVVLIAAAAAAVSIVFCVALRKSEAGASRLLPNRFVRIFVFGTVIVLLLKLLHTTDYAGAGMNIISDAVSGRARPEAFALKLLFTVLAVSGGYKGGEIVPAMFIGATLGCTLGQLTGLDPSLGAAVGLLSMFCGSLNCPISSLFLGIELFGGAGLQYFAIGCAVSYMLSANFGLYKEQKIVYSKIHPEFIDRYTD